MSDIKYIENENEVAEAIAGGGNVVLLFSAPWCGSCKAIKSRIQQVLNTPKHQDIVCLGIDVDEFPDLARKYVIRSLPSTKCFSARNECGGSTGIMTSGQINEMFTGFKKVYAKEPEACDDDESETVAEPSQEEAERTIEKICTEYGLTRLGLFKRLLIAGEENKAVEDYKKEHEPEQQMGLSAINDASGNTPKHTSGYMQPRSQGKTFSVPGLHVYKAKPRTVTAVQCGADNFDAMRALAGVRIMEGYTNAFARFLNEDSVVVDVKPGWWLVRRDDTPAIITLIPGEAFRATYDLCD